MALYEPDFSNVVGNLNNLGNQLGQYGQTSWDWSTGMLNNFQNAVDTSGGIANRMATGAAGAADVQRSGYSKYLPVMNKNIGTAMNWDSPENIARAQGMSAGQLGGQYKQAGEAAKADLTSFGVKPSDVKFAGLDFSLKAKQAADTVAQNNAIRQKMQTDAFGMRQGVIGTGLNEAGLANQTGAGAVAAGQAPVQAYGTMAGAASPYRSPLGYTMGAGTMYGAGGNFMNTAFQNSVENQKLGMMQDQIGSGVGTALGIGASSLGGGKGISALGDAIGRWGGGSSGTIQNSSGGVVPNVGTGTGQTYAGGGDVGYGHLQQPHAPPGVSGPHAARTEGMFGPGELSEGRRNWKYYYGGGGVEGRSTQSMAGPGQESNQQEYAAGQGVIPISEQGGYVSPQMSPSGGDATDDIPAVIQNTSPQRPAAINAGEFIFTRKAATEIGHDKLRRQMQKAEAKADGGGRDHPANAGQRPTAHFAGGDSVMGQRSASYWDRVRDSQPARGAPPEYLQQLSPQYWDRVRRTTEDRRGREGAPSGPSESGDAEHYAGGGNILHDLVGDAGSALGMMIPIPVAGPMIGRLAGHELYDVASGDNSAMGTDAANDTIGKIPFFGKKAAGAITGKGGSGGASSGGMGDMASASDMGDMPDMADAGFSFRRGGVIQMGRRASPFRRAA